MPWLDPNPYSSTLIIEELTAATPNGDRRTITLVGSTLPVMGAGWSGENQLVTTWYPGNGDQATQQNLGPREMPSKWNGEWHRTLMSRTPAQLQVGAGESNKIIEPHVLRDTMEDLARSGMRLRVTWYVRGTIGVDGEAKSLTNGVDESFKDSALDTQIVREGRIKTWDFKYTRAQDIVWDIEFHWMSRGLRDAPKATTTRSNTVSNNTGAMQAAIDRLRRANFIASQQKFKPGFFTLGQLEALANLPTTIVNRFARQVTQMENQVRDLVSIATKLRSQPFQIANTALNLAKNTIAIANRSADELQRTPAERMCTKSNVSDVTRAFKAFGTTSDDARALARASEDYRFRIQSSVHNPPGAGRLRPSSTSQTTGTIIAAYVTKDGDTPQRISLKFYSTPDHALDILKANRLPWHTATFDKGKILIIPVLASVTQGA